MANPYQASAGWPYHLSVGAVVRNGDGEVLVHHFTDIKIEGRVCTDVYTLIRETVEAGESLEAALNRGLMEEAGTTAEVEHYLGHIEAPVRGEQFSWTKTTVYFAMRLRDFDPNKRLADDPEAGSKLEWHDPAALAKILTGQKEIVASSDLDELVIIERLMEAKND